MIPKLMESFLKEVLPERTWQNRLVRENGKCFMEFNSMDVDRLNRLGIHPDKLGPKMVACIWDENSPLEVGGYLVVDNLAMGRPAMGGIRISNELTPARVFHLARGMTLKNAAANLPYGGGKAGIIADPKKLNPEQHQDLIRSFARLLNRYTDIFLPGPDAGTRADDMKIVASENGLDTALSKPAELGGARGDETGAAGGGLIIALRALLQEMPRLKVLPQFANLQIPDPDQISIILQGFGAVGAQAGRILLEKLPEAKLVGVSDSTGYIYNSFGLPVEQLYSYWQESRVICLPFYRDTIAPEKRRKATSKFGTMPEDLLREDAFCFIPASPISNYLDSDAASQPAMTVDRMGKWAMILEGANTYSPEPAERAQRERMERAVYRQKGILIATDYLVNSGAVIYGAQENLIKTPPHLRIPDAILGDQPAVNTWLEEHKDDLLALAEKRRAAGEKARAEVITRNMHELVDLLISDADLLPCEAAERISVQRITARERKRTAADLMERAITIPETDSIQQAAALALETRSATLVVTGKNGELAGVITDWDITRATADGLPASQALSTIMTRQVIAVSPQETILEIVRKLEYHEVSALPVVSDNAVVGLVSADLLARKSLYPLLISQTN